MTAQIQPSSPHRLGGGLRSTTAGWNQRTNWHHTNTVGPGWSQRCRDGVVGTASCSCCTVQVQQRFNLCCRDGLLSVLLAVSTTFRQCCTLQGRRWVPSLKLVRTVSFGFAPRSGCDSCPVQHLTWRTPPPPVPSAEVEPGCGLGKGLEATARNV